MTMNSAIRLKYTQQWSGNCYGRDSVMNTTISNWRVDHTPPLFVQDNCNRALGETVLNFYTDGSKAWEEVSLRVHSREQYSLQRLPDYCRVSTTAHSRAAVVVLDFPSMRTRKTLDCRSSRNDIAVRFDIRILMVPGLYWRILRRIGLLDLAIPYGFYWIWDAWSAFWTSFKVRFGYL